MDLKWSRPDGQFGKYRAMLVRSLGQVGAERIPGWPGATPRPSIPYVAVVLRFRRMRASIAEPGLCVPIFGGCHGRGGGRWCSCERTLRIIGALIADRGCDRPQADSVLIAVARRGLLSCLEVVSIHLYSPIGWMQSPCGGELSNGQMSERTAHHRRTLAAQQVCITATERSHGNRASSCAMPMTID